ncbi:hypothetical protein Trydic_g19047 [Trypoxylus dichotomus]
MKEIIVFCCLVGISISAKLDNTYLPPSSAGTAGGNNFLQTPYQGIHSGNSVGFPNTNGFPRNNGFTFPSQTFQRDYQNNGFPSSSLQRYNQGNSAQSLNGPNAGYRPLNTDSILRYNNQNNGDGSYQFDFETGNKISQKEVGQVSNAGLPGESNIVRGDYSYVAPDGKTVSVNYIADENGFRASGDHIPAGSSGQYRGQLQSTSFRAQNTGYNGQSPSQDKQVENQIRPLARQYGLNQIGGTGSTPFGSQDGFPSTSRQGIFDPLNQSQGNGFAKGSSGLFGTSGASRQYLPPSHSVQYGSY